MSFTSGEVAETMTLAMPPELLPDALRRLPTFDAELFSQLGRSGYAGVGVVPAVLERTDVADDPTVLMLHHHEHDNALGLLSETVKGDDSGIESPEDTASRAFGEEIGLHDVAELGLMMPARGGWVAIQALKNRKIPGKYLLGIVFPLFTSTVRLEEIIEQTAETPEIGTARAMQLTDVLKTDDRLLRAFAKPALWALGAAGLYEREVALTPFTPPAFDPNAPIRPDFTHSRPIFT